MAILGNNDHKKSTPLKYGSRFLFQEVDVKINLFFKHREQNANRNARTQNAKIPAISVRHAHHPTSWIIRINLDALGYKNGKTAYSFYNCQDAVVQKARSSFSGNGEFVEGEQWYQGDHSIFVQLGVPALAITSEKFIYLTSYVTHTQADSPDLVDISKLIGTVYSLTCFLKNLCLD